MTPNGEALAALLISLIDGQPVPALYRDALVIGLLQALRDERPLDEVFGLSGAGKRSLYTQALTARRNHHIVLASELLAPNSSLWQQATRLSKEIKRFSVAWRRTKALPFPPQHWPQWKQSIWKAAKTDRLLPTSPRQLYRLLTHQAKFSCQYNYVMMLSDYT